ncbi:MAG: Hsp70 family protein [Pseudonocardiaceae bacterium]
MRYALGVDVGTSFTAAAICRSDDHQQNKADVVALGSRMPSVPSVLFLGADGSVVVGEAAERRALTDPDRVVRGFKRRIGDDTPLLVAGQPYAAHDLAAMVVRWVVDRVTEREGGTPDRIAITHPAGWGPYKKDLLACALVAVGLDDLTFIAEPEAAAVSYATQERVEAGTTIAVYDLGGGTFDAAVVHKTGAGSFALLGSADGLEQLGGADFDEAVFTRVQADTAQSDTTRWDTLDVDNPSVLSGLARLRRECTEAKEALSSDTEVSIPVLLPEVSADVRLGRSEFEEMIRPALEDTVDSLSRAIRSAELSSGDLGAVLLVGGSSRIPLVSQLVSAALGCPVVVDADPKTTIALGAALSIAPQTQPAPTATVAIAAPAIDPESPTSREHLPNQMPNHAPDRPPMVPAQRESLEDREATEDDASLRRRIVTGRVRNVVGVGVLSGVLLVALAVAAPGDGLRSVTGGSSDAAPVSVAPPDSAVAAGDSSGNPVETDGAGSPNVTSSGKQATRVAQTTGSVSRAATSTAGRPAVVSSGNQGERGPASVPPPPSDPAASEEGGTNGGDTANSDTTNTTDTDTTNTNTNTNTDTDTTNTDTTNTDTTNTDTTNTDTTNTDTDTDTDTTNSSTANSDTTSNTAPTANPPPLQTSTA